MKIMIVHDDEALVASMLAAMAAEIRDKVAKEAEEAEALRKKRHESGNVFPWETYQYNPMNIHSNDAIGGTIKVEPFHASAPEPAPAPIPADVPQLWCRKDGAYGAFLYRTTDPDECGQFIYRDGKLGSPESMKPARLHPHFKRLTRQEAIGFVGTDVVDRVLGVLEREEKPEWPKFYASEGDGVITACPSVNPANDIFAGRGCSKWESDYPPYNRGLETYRLITLAEATAILGPELMAKCPVNVNKSETVNNEPR